MRSHVLRPLLVVIGLVALLFVFRYFYVPQDFAIHENGFTYGLYRSGAVTDWKNVTVKYQGDESCKACHRARGRQAGSSYPHMIIQCENCHGPAWNHPTDPPKLPSSTVAGVLLRDVTPNCPTRRARGRRSPASTRQTHNTGLRMHPLPRPAPAQRAVSALQPRGLREASRTAARTTARIVTRTSSTTRAGIRTRMRAIECESCHGPATRHPVDPPKLPIDTTRELCLGCHTRLPYSSTAQRWDQGRRPGALTTPASSVSSATTRTDRLCSSWTGRRYAPSRGPEMTDVISRRDFLKKTTIAVAGVLVPVAAFEILRPDAGTGHEDRRSGAMGVRRRYLQVRRLRVLREGLQARERGPLRRQRLAHLGGAIRADQGRRIPCRFSDGRPRRLHRSRLSTSTRAALSPSRLKTSTRPSSSRSSATSARSRRACRSARSAPPSGPPTVSFSSTGPGASAAATASWPARTAPGSSIRSTTRPRSARSATTASPRA